MRKFLKYILAVFLCAALAACGTTDSKEEAETSEKSLSIVATIFPAYDWVREILGGNPGNVQLTFLLDSGTDMHSYQPTAADMVKIAECDLFVYTGGESDSWTADAIRESVNPDLTPLSLMDVLSDSVREEEIIEGMQAEEEEEEAEYDEHVWLSLSRAEKAVETIAGVIAEKDPENAQTYRDNADAYIRKLEDLDNQYRECVNNSEVRTLVFADRFPFRYLTDDYGIQYYAAFAGCSAETEASFETIRFLASKMDELDLTRVMTIENSDEKIARTVIENTEKKDMKILHLDSMQSTDAKAVSAGATYLSLMRDNL
ncbi:MAG: metal ABC transporter substrate-binding protein, partial [Erysipelotrichaceae bacterium]|nr:metal ABC transporter substrate-binding protein [Erysipelotrichaceae bacterium]